MRSHHTSLTSLRKCALSILSNDVCLEPSPQAAGPSGRVLCLEPAPRTSAALAANMQQHAAWCTQRGHKVRGVVL